jgi:hypothetical protein
MIQGVTVIGDVMRPDGAGRPGGVDRATIWLFDAIKRQAHLACGLPIDVITANGVPHLRAWLETQRAPPDAHRQWAAAYRQLPPSSDIDAHLIPRLRHRFCIGYELPPYLLRLLQSLDVPHVDLRLHPVRFLDDLLFAAHASHPGTQAALLDAAMPESQVIVTAGLREAMCHLISDAAVPANTLIVVGQRPLDCTQIVDGGFYDALPHAAAIHAICARYAAVLLKPHPLEPEHSLLAVASAAPNVAGVVRDNLYRLMSLPEAAAVLTVNSSVAYEAPYFGKRVHALAPLPICVGWRGGHRLPPSWPGLNRPSTRGQSCEDGRVKPGQDGGSIGCAAIPAGQRFRDPASDTPEPYASLDDQVLSVDFWRMVLAPHAPVSAADGVRLPPKPNRLRIALDSFWNFQEIDTDRVPQRPRA